MIIQTWNGKTVPRMGVGTWVMGGEQYWGDQATGWSGVDDDESVAALLAAFDCGVRIIDTADQYGGGHAERIIARAIAESGIARDEFVLCTKVGMVCDPQTRNLTGVTDRREDIAAAIDACLARLNTDHLDLVKFHLNDHPVDQSAGVFDAFSAAFEAGKIAGFGWSTDDVAGALAFADRPGYVAVQHDLNLFKSADEMLRALENRNLWAFNRQPLAMGLLTGKHAGVGAKLGANDIRGSGADWLAYFNDGGASADLSARLEKVRTLLTADGRTLAQGALGWVLAQSDRCVPIPGCRTPAQARDNFGTIARGPLAADVVAEIAEVLAVG